MFLANGIVYKQRTTIDNHIKCEKTGANIDE